MFQRRPYQGPRNKAVVWLGGTSLLVIALIAAYANYFHNSFHFDDAHTIVNNAAIRELRNIPRFFCDATTFSSLPTNQSYRPLVSTLLAIDYRLGGGLRPFCFHLSVFVLFAGLTALLAYLIYRILQAVADHTANGWIALAAAGLYGLHPANADTVNYIIASSEVISALGVVGSFAVYLAFPRLRRYYVYVVPAALGILAKPTAAIFAVLFAVYLLLFGRKDARLTRLRNTPACQAETRVQRTAEIAIPFIVCGAVLWFVQLMTPRNWIAGAANVRNYLITQPYVALLYAKTFFWPGDLSADYDLNPFTTTDDPRFWLGFAFITFFVAAATIAAVLKKTRVIGFGLLWFLIALLPTSLFALAEVMNDHRTFLPYIGLVIAIAGAASLLVSRQAKRSLPVKIAATGTVILILCASGYATFQRNKVWKTEESLWRNVATKSPRNPRGLMNYGNTLMAKGDFAGALDHFHRALAFAPRYSFLLINLAIAEEATKQSQAAEQHFRDALQLAPTSPDSYSYYARYLLSHARAAEAVPLLQKALDLSPSDVTARDLLAQANTQMTNPTQTPESYLTLSLQLYQEQRYAEAIDACQAALKLRPDYAEAWNNICATYNKLGRYEEAAAACEQALRYKPDWQLARNNLQYARDMAKASTR
jgi:tetratricopeptide (TPR) repeat protein